MTDRIKLGDKVKDSITGYKGVVICIHSYLNGCRRISVQPDKTNKDGGVPDHHTFDEPQLVMVKAKKVKEGSHVTGGPHHAMDAGR